MRSDILDYDLEQGHILSFAVKENFISEGRANQIRTNIIENYQVVDFLNEVEEQDWELDADDIRHILNMDFDYVRKQYQITLQVDSKT